LVLGKIIFIIFVFFIKIWFFIFDSLLKHGDELLYGFRGIHSTNRTHIQIYITAIASVILRRGEFVVNVGSVFEHKANRDAVATGTGVGYEIRAEFHGKPHFLSIQLGETSKFIIFIIAYWGTF